jgi:hypothetical protein
MHFTVAVHAEYDKVATAFTIESFVVSVVNVKPDNGFVQPAVFATSPCIIKGLLA